MFIASENIDFTGLSHVFLLGGGERSVLFLLARLPTQTACCALAFVGRDSRAKNVPLERFFDALHFKRAGASRCVFIFMGN